MPDINAMTDEEFLEYVEGLEDGEDFDAEEEIEEPLEEVQEEGAEELLNDTASEEEDAIESGLAPYEKGVSDGRNQRLMSHIKSLYPDLSEEDAVDMFLDDADRQTAEAEGMTLEDFREARQERADYADFKAERERKRQDENAINSIVEKWKEDTKRMQGILPDFDFEKAMEQSQFRDKVIKEGKDIISAYFELNPINKAPLTSARRDIEVADMPGGVANGFKSPFDIEKASKEEFEKYVKERLDNE